MISTSHRPSVSLRAALLPIVAAIVPLTSFAEEARPAAAGIHLIPPVKTLVPAQGEFALSPATRIVCSNPELSPLAAILSREISTLCGITPAASAMPSRAGDISLHLDPALKGEAYTVKIDEQAEIRAGNYQALASATVTLLQLLRHEEPGKASLPRVQISDQPDLAFRSAMIDLGRKYHSVGGIKQVVQLCRFYKIRYLHLHLSDDQLFMFPSKRFSKAGKTNAEFARFEPAAQEKSEPYSREELVDLDRFAREHGVLIIPEIDLPGHSGRLIANEPRDFAMPGNGSTVHIANPKTCEAVEALLNEVMDVFQSGPYVHIGADEVSLAGLEETPEYRDALKKDPTLKTPHDLYCKFVNHLHSIVTKRGKKTLVWEEGWNPGGPYPLPKDAVVVVWSQGRNPVDIASSGYSIVNTTWTPLYIVRDNKKSPEFLHAWNPSLFGRENSEEYTHLEDTSKLIGAQLTSWENSEAIEIQSMRERLAIVAERCWDRSGATGDYASFRQRWEKTDAKLDLIVHPIAMEVDGKFTRDENTFSEPITVRLTSRKEGFTIRYTLDNTLPNSGWKDYEAPLAIDRTVFLRAGLFDRRGKQTGPLLGAWFRSEADAKR
ncbi:family 20 glycosylhydrolase [Luteolibacter flavescens]|uniref:beta-N-acetylhexosaminidase n=1 Tax=Luteolibacter flavescens TaxID=1859460 RepID=A0ABT3FSW3_9BACT|nr:family 20 glycosylhydrolase [Luteolibacter flavescens]MCW1886676.1 family 20 glycosylhydrolase [Luteolibacter flavescens]